jgi:hypothetical protein
LISSENLYPETYDKQIYKIMLRFLNWRQISKTVYTRGDRRRNRLRRRLPQPLQRRSPRVHTTADRQPPTVTIADLCIHGAIVGATSCRDDCRNRSRRRSPRVYTTADRQPPTVTIADIKHVEYLATVAAPLPRVYATGDRLRRPCKLGPISHAFRAVTIAAYRPNKAS